MNEQVYGVFSSIENAEQAIASLKDHGVRGEEVSVVRRSDGTGLPQLENEADHTITTTSADDVVSGAMKGGAVGLALGILGGAIALTIPGIGPILAAGPLIAALGTTAVSTAAGVIGGGVVGLLVDQGLPTEAAARYNDAIHRGDILVSVRSIHVSTADARMLLSKYGATDIETHRVGEAVSTRPNDLDPPIIDRTAEAEATPTAAQYEAERRASTMGTVAPAAVPAPVSVVTMPTGGGASAYDAPMSAVDTNPATSPNASTGATFGDETARRTGRATDLDVDLDLDEPRPPVSPQARAAGLREIGPDTSR